MSNCNSFAVANRPLIGISQCLLGDAVRYDGGDKYQPLLARELQPHVRFSGFCPEVAAGLGVPREPVHLLAGPGGVRAVGVRRPQLDVTAAISTASHRIIEQLQNGKGLCGYVLKARSPSCGLGTAPLSYEKINFENVSRGEVASEEVEADPDRGNGVFAERLTRHLPHLVLAQESDLNDVESCQRFLSACYLLWRDHHRQVLEPELDRLLDRGWQVEDLWSPGHQPESGHRHADHMRHRDPGHKKAVPWERLFRYWADRTN